MSERLEIRYSICHWCHDKCPVELHLKNGQLEKQVGDRRHPNAAIIRRGVTACPRARHAAEWYYHADRTKFPLKRRGERGEGKWQQISWEQALDEVAAKLAKIRDRYGSEAVATSSGTYRTHDEYRIRFFHAFGSPNNIGQGAICYGPHQIVAGAILGWPLGRAGSIRDTKLTLVLGTNSEQCHIRDWIDQLDALKKGAKIIVVDPRKTAPAERAAIWLQPRPGTDAALYMSLINVIIEEELYNKEFVDKWCYGFDRLRERAREYPPEKVQEITWVPAEKIRAVARMYATSKPATTLNGMGVEHLHNCVEALHAIKILFSITGNVDITGGDRFAGPPPGYISDYEINLNDAISPEQKAKQLGADRFRLQTFPGYDLIMKYNKRKQGRDHLSFAHAPTVYRAMITGKPYPVRAMLTVASNPLITAPNSKLVYKALKSLDLYVVTDFFMTPSAELADYVFPPALWMEKPLVFNYGDAVPWLLFAEAAMPGRVEGQYDRRPDYDLWRGLALRLGLGKYFPWETLEDAYNYRLKPLGKTLKQFCDEGGSYIPVMPEKQYEKEGFGTPTGKIELYSTVLEKLGYDPLPRYYEPPETPVSRPDLATEYPLILITGGRHLPYFHSEHRQIDSLRKMHPDPIIQINPKTAAELGIHDGDWVWIETPRGRVRQKCKYFDGIDPRVVHAQHGWWFPELPGEEPWLHGAWESNINVCTDDDPDHCNPINGGWPLKTALCKIYGVKMY